MRYPRFAQATHSLSHVFYETSDHLGGRSFLSGWLPGCERDAPMFAHLKWHIALFELASGHSHYGRVMDLYACDMEPTIMQARTTLSDTASLLWRLHIYARSASTRPRCFCARGWGDASRRVTSSGWARRTRHGGRREEAAASLRAARDGSCDADPDAPEIAALASLEGAVLTQRTRATRAVLRTIDRRLARLWPCAQCVVGRPLDVPKSYSGFLHIVVEGRHEYIPPGQTPTSGALFTLGDPNGQSRAKLAFVNSGSSVRIWPSALFSLWYVP